MHSYETAPQPPPSPPFPAISFRPHTGGLRKRDKLLMGEGGRGWARSRIIRPQESLVLYKLFTTLWSRPFFSLISSDLGWWKLENSYFYSWLLDAFCALINNIILIIQYFWNFRSKVSNCAGVHLYMWYLFFYFLLFFLFSKGTNFWAAVSTFHNVIF